VGEEDRLTDMASNMSTAAPHEDEEGVASSLPTSVLVALHCVNNEGVVSNSSPSGTQATPHVDEKGVAFNHPTFILPTYPSVDESKMNVTSSKKVILNAQDEVAYMQKWNELQKYVPNLRNWIARLNFYSNKDKKQFSKLYSLYDLLQNPSKRLVICIHDL